MGSTYCGRHGPRVAVIGAGLGGAAIAGLMQRIGYDVAVYEQYDRFVPAGGGIHLSPNLMRVMRCLGVHRHVLLKGQEPHAFLNRDAVTGDMLYALKLGEAANRRFGAPFVALRHLRFRDPGSLFAEMQRLCTSRELEGRVVDFVDGITVIRKLRDDWCADRGGKEAWKEFHDQFLSYGGPPIPLIRKDMLKDTKNLF